MDLCDKDCCTGCMACVNICPQNCINIFLDKEGFKYPNIDQLKCINCGLCNKACPILNPLNYNNGKKTRAYAAWNLNNKIRYNSTSGGAFSALAENILENKGIVCGVELIKSLEARHIIINNIKELYKLQGSKYVQSDINHIYQDVKQYLETDVKVLFSGTPCQIAGLYGYLLKNYENLFTVELVCHGVASNLILNYCVQNIDKKVGSIVSVNFRDKKNGWQTSTISYKGNNIITSKSYKDLFMSTFYAGYSHRLSCYTCPFSTLPRIADLTLADFWGINETIFSKKEYKKGISLILVNNEKGMSLLKSSISKLYITERPLKEALKGNRNIACARGYDVYVLNKRKLLFKLISNNIPYKTIFKKIVSVSNKQRIARIIGLKITKLIQNYTHRK